MTKRLIDSRTEIKGLFRFMSFQTISFSAKIVKDVCNSAKTWQYCQLTKILTIQKFSKNLLRIYILLIDKKLLFPK